MNVVRNLFGCQFLFSEFVPLHCLVDVYVKPRQAEHGPRSAELGPDAEAASSGLPRGAERHCIGQEDAEPKQGPGPGGV